MTAKTASLRAQMLRANTPVEHYPELGLFVKREDLACLPPGPQFSKTRGVFTRVANRVADGFRIIGALDTFHSQAGHAVARACQLLGVRCVNFYPEYKHDPGHRPPQARAVALGAELVGIPAGMSAVLFNIAKGQLRKRYGDASYMMPNALKLDESVEETANEVGPDCLDADVVIVPVSSATIAAGVIKGFIRAGRKPHVVLHMGYSRSHDGLRQYVEQRIETSLMSSNNPSVELIDEGYSYKQQSRHPECGVPPFPCSPYYDLKAFHWWVREGRERFSASRKALMWNVG